MFDDPWLEQGLTTLSFVALVAYHLHLIYRIHRTPLATAIGLNTHTRRVWVETIMEKQLDILAIQTLRNWSMAASFLASAAILISLGILNAAFITGGIGGTPQLIMRVSHESGGIWLVKLLFLIVTFFFAFFNFTLAIRSYNRVGFMINIPTERDPLITPAFVANMLAHGMNHYSLGMRGYYLAVPLVLWLFGPLWLAIGTVVLILVMYRIDYNLD
ncbi:MAG: DUF599 domain-containing protein [Gammaproteobacteria bacterium]